MSSMAIPNASAIAFADFSLPPVLPVSIWAICEYETPDSRAKSLRICLGTRSSTRLYHHRLAYSAVYHFHTAISRTRIAVYRVTRHHTVFIGVLAILRCAALGEAWPCQ